MSPRKGPHRLVEAAGLAFEYAVVDRDHLHVVAIDTALIEQLNNANERSSTVWAPGFMAHQLVLRSTKPDRRQETLLRKVINEIRDLNKALEDKNAMLLPTAAHPLLVPSRDAVIGKALQPSEYRQLDRLFDLNQHAWCNAQQNPLELTYTSDEELGKLLASLRLLSTIIPAMGASSPVQEGRWCVAMDGRLWSWLHAHERHPELMGPVIPEAVFNLEEIDREITGPLARGMAALDAPELADHELANNRLIIVRPERGTVLVRALDMQECPSADLALTEFIIAVTRAMASGRWVSNYLQRAWSDADLVATQVQVIKEAGSALISNRDLLFMFGLMKQEHMTAAKLWQHLFVEVYGELSEGTRKHIGTVLENGCLSSRILKHTGKRPTLERLRSTYAELARCLQEDRAFL